MNLNLNLGFTKRRGGSYRPPKQDELEQWLTGTERAVGTFDGADEALGDVTTVLGGGWKRAFCFTYIVESISGSNRLLYLWGSNKTQRISMLRSGANMQIFFDDGPNTILKAVTANFVTGGKYIIDLMVNGSEYYMSINDAPQAVVDISPVNMDITFDGVQISSASISANGAILYDVYFGDELFKLDEGEGLIFNGSKGSALTAIDANPQSLWRYNLSEDRSNNGTYATHDLDLDLWNLNASGLVTATGFPAKDEWKTKAEIAVAPIYNGTTTFTPEATYPDMRTRIYKDGTVLTADEIALNNKKVGR